MMRLPKSISPTINPLQLVSFSRHGQSGNNNDEAYGLDEVKEIVAKIT
jgi:hypothetical protein